MISRKYNLINNIGGWVVFIIALITYWLTLEPTASYWDCGEFIIQADKLGAKGLSPLQYLIVMGSAAVGSLAYCWSDTFWFSAVEGEVYAFSSFCTALVFWLILKWENRADDPGSDRYLILIAYIIGVKWRCLPNSILSIHSG